MVLELKIIKITLFQNYFLNKVSLNTKKHTIIHKRGNKFFFKIYIVELAVSYLDGILQHTIHK